MQIGELEKRRERFFGSSSNSMFHVQLDKQPVTCVLMLHHFGPLLVSFQNFWEVRVCLGHFLHWSSKQVGIFLIETKWHTHTQFWIEKYLKLQSWEYFHSFKFKFSISTWILKTYSLWRVWVTDPRQTNKYVEIISKPCDGKKKHAMVFQIALKT